MDSRQHKKIIVDLKNREDKLILHNTNQKSAYRIRHGSKLKNIKIFFETNAPIPLKRG